MDELDKISGIYGDGSAKIHIGSLPPPLGGVSVYLYRLSKMRPGDIFMDPRNLSRWQKVSLALTATREIVVQGNYWKVIFLLRAAASIRKKPYSIVLHGMGAVDALQKGGWGYRQIVKLCLRGARSIQVVGEHIRRELLKYMPDLEPKIFVQNAFLPPPLEDEPKILATYEPETIDFIKRSAPLIVANAFRLVEWSDGTDLYGLDMCVELMRRLKAVYPSAGLLFALADGEYRSGYLALMRGRIEQYGLTENFHFMTGQKELWPIFRSADLMVRPTYTDGYGASIAEALYFDCPAVASDISERPKGTILFRSRDDGDFYDKVFVELNQKYEGKNWS